MTEKDVYNIPGMEWAIFRLGTTTTVVSVEVDTNHFKGNSPDYVTIEGTMQHGDSSTEFNEKGWTVIIEKMRLQPHKQHFYKREIKNVGPFNCVRITIAPDGGISRVRILGHRFIEKPAEEAAKETTEFESTPANAHGTSNEIEDKPANDTKNFKNENHQEQNAENGCDSINPSS